MRRLPTVFLGLLLVMSSLSGCLFSGEDDNAQEELFPVIKFSPNSNIRVGDLVYFDASSSTPSDGSLTYRWDFDSDDSIDETGRTAEWTFQTAGTFEVTLTISDGSRSQETSKSISIGEAGAEPPVATITQYSDAEDCEDEAINENTHIVVWICERDKELSDRSIDATINIELDGSNSDSGDPSQYITSWHWDLDLNDDADSDGDNENDADLSGETIQWENVEPGEYEIALTVTNDVGFVDTDTIRVYVSYAGYWLDFEMDGNTSNNAAEKEFDVKIVYDKDGGNTIRKAVAELTYPKEDNDCTPVFGTNNCRAKLDIYAYNEDDDEAANTSGTGVDQRTDGDCDEDTNDCIHLTLSSYLFTDSESTFGDGEWTITIQNDKLNDLAVESFVLRLYYK